MARNRVIRTAGDGNGFTGESVSFQGILQELWSRECLLSLVSWIPILFTVYCFDLKEGSKIPKVEESFSLGI